MRKKQRGFSLIELLIVVAIILIIAAIAIPNLLRARIAANESSAVSSIRTMNTAQVTFQSTYPTVGYAGTVAALGPAASTGCTTPTSTNACLVDWVVSQASVAGTAKSGYWFGDTPVAGGPERHDPWLHPGAVSPPRLTRPGCAVSVPTKML